MGRWPFLWGVAGDWHSGKRKIGQGVAFSHAHRRHRAMRCGFCFPSCNPKARRQGFIEHKCCRCIPTGADEPTSDIVTTSGIVTTSNIVIARPSHPSHQFG
jgi:hypothetical protein